jgi:hypothetical protein
MWQKFKDWCAREWAAVKKSGTMLLAWLTSAVGLIAGTLADLYNDPSVNDAIKSALDPKYIPWYVLGFGLLLRLVRKKNSDL